MSQRIRSQAARDAYRAFLLKRAPARTRTLGMVGLMGIPTLILLDLLDSRWGMGAPLTLAQSAAVRLPWTVLALLCLLVLPRVLSPKALPAGAFWATLLYAVGNDGAVYALGLVGTPLH